jgi:hypothetical protein
MNPFDATPSLTSGDRPDYLPPPPRAAVLKDRVGWYRAGLLASLLLPPLVLFLGENSGAELRKLVEQGRTTTGTIARRG